MPGAGLASPGKPERRRKVAVGIQRTAAGALALDLNQQVPGLRLFSRTRALALAGWLGGLEPVRLRVTANQLILDAGQDDSWLVSDLAPRKLDRSRKPEAVLPGRAGTAIHRHPERTR